MLSLRQLPAAARDPPARKGVRNLRVFWLYRGVRYLQADRASGVLLHEKPLRRGRCYLRRQLLLSTMRDLTIAFFIFLAGVVVSASIARQGRSPRGRTIASFVSFIVPMLTLYPLVSFFADGRMVSFHLWFLSAFVGAGVFYLLGRISKP